MITKQVTDYKASLKAYRVSQHITQAQMAERLGVSLRSYQRWESTDMEPQGENKNKVDGVLNEQ